MKPETEVKRLREVCAALSQVLGSISLDIDKLGNSDASDDLIAITELLAEAARGKCPSKAIDVILPWWHQIESNI